MARRWPKIAGKSIADYMEEATVDLTEPVFARKFQEYVKTMNLSEDQDVDSAKVLHVLFQIMREFLQRRAAVSAMTNANIEQDWRKRKRFIKSRTKDLAHVRDLAEHTLQKEDTPLTRALAESIRKKLDTLLQELEKILAFQRLQESMFATLRPSVYGETRCVLMLNEYMEDRFSGLSKREHDIIIAGAMIAAGIKRDIDEPVTNVPMARSRARKSLDEDGIVVPWLDKVERPGGPQKS